MMKSAHKCPPFSIISSAANGDNVAIEKILNHYDAYISKASLRPFYDEQGNMYIVVDMELKGRIRTALIKAILGFEVRVK
ncbi:MAG: helix-turn-helix domain-containing protein [Firmicutes bacterium]|nr:helix-turn-helix domain-containing protein [Bacillota bacterium]